MRCSQPPGRGREWAQSPSRSPAAVRPVLGRRAAVGGWEGGDPAPPGRPLGRGLKGLRISAGLAMPGFGVLQAGTATPRPGGFVREASAALRLGLRFLRRCPGLGGRSGAPLVGAEVRVFREGVRGGEGILILERGVTGISVDLLV